MKIANGKQKVSLVLLSSLSLFIFANDTHAYSSSLFPWWQQKTWQPIVTLGAGASFSSDKGTSQNFPIQEPITDEFFNYSAFTHTQTSGFGEGFLGAEWNPYCSNWLVQAGLDYMQTATFSAQGTFTQGVDFLSEDSFTYHYNVKTKQFLAEGKFLYTLKKIYHPYFLVGLGLAFNKAFNYSTNVPPFLTFTRMYQDNANSALSYALGFGVDTDIGHNLRLGLGYRFADLGKFRLGSASIDNTNVSGTLSQSHLYTNQVLAQLTFVI